MKSAVSAYQKKIGDIDKGEADTISKLEGERSSREIPKYVPPQQAPTKQTTPQEAWASSAMMLAVVASAITRAPLTSAFNAAAAALKGFHEGDMEAFKNATEQWKVATENAIELERFQQQAYDKAMGDVTRRETLAGKEAASARHDAYAEVLAVSAQFKDQVAGDAAKARQWDALQRIFDARKRAADSAQKAAEQNYKQAQFILAMDSWKKDFVKQNGHEPTPEDSLKEAGRLHREEGGIGAMTETQITATQERMAKALTAKNTPGEQYLINQKGETAVRSAFDTHPDGKGIALQADLLDSYVRRINGNMALREFQLNVLQRHQGLVDKAQQGFTNMLHGGVLSPDMIRDMRIMMADYDRLIGQQFANSITRQQWVAFNTPGTDPKEITPPFFNPPATRPDGRPWAPRTGDKYAAAVDRLRTVNKSDDWIMFDNVFGPGAAAEALHPENR